MKLTQERLKLMVRWVVDPDQAWKMVEEDREAIREETRAEVLKDH